MTWLVVAMRNGIRPGGGLRHLYLADQMGRLGPGQRATVPQHLCWVNDRKRAHRFPTEGAAGIGRRGMSSCPSFAVAIAREDHHGSMIFVDDDVPARPAVTAEMARYAQAYYVRNAVDLYARMQRYVEGCCGKKTGKQMCDSYGCGTLADFMEILGEPPPEREAEAEVEQAPAKPNELLAGSIDNLRELSKMFWNQGEVSRGDYGLVEGVLLLLRDLQRRGLG